MKRIPNKQREMHERMLAVGSHAARLWAILETRPSPPTPDQRLRWIVAAYKRYEVHKTLKGFRRYGETLIRHLGEPAALVWIESTYGGPRDGRNRDDYEAPDDR